MRRQVKIAVSKINKNNIKSRSFTNGEGVEVEIKELEVDLIDLKEQKVVFENDKGKLVKVGFMAEKSFKDGEGKWKNGTTLGDITEWHDKEVKSEQQGEVEYPNEEINAEDIPF